jgi:hypothetical protein
VSDNDDEERLESEVFQGSARDGDDDDQFDTGLEPAEFMAQILRVDRTSAEFNSGHPLHSSSYLGQAEELDVGEVNIPTPADLGRGKRTKRVSTRYQSDYVVH